MSRSEWNRRRHRVRVIRRRAMFAVVALLCWAGPAPAQAPAGVLPAVEPEEFALPPQIRGPVAPDGGR